MNIKFYWGEYDEVEFEYELEEEELKKLRELAKEDLLNRLNGETIEEKAQQIIDEYDWEEDEPEDVIDEMVEIMLADGEYDDLAKELFEDSAKEQYDEIHSYKDEYDYYGISRWDFF